MKPRFLPTTMRVLRNGIPFPPICSTALPSPPTEKPYAGSSKIHKRKYLTIKFI